ncbi:hypothetical protein LEP1GSC072_2022 [Leptospira noguchii str. Bonito]|nr:hypothetical protein LEP1GSC072_2022 [Leptospira noguchii str. Bonito]
MSSHVLGNLYKIPQEGSSYQISAFNRCLVTFFKLKILYRGRLKHSNSM